MAIRTVHLPDDLDDLCTRLELDVSQLVRDGVVRYLENHPNAALEAQVDLASERIAALGLHWPDGWMAESRRLAAER